MLISKLKNSSLEQMVMYYKELHQIKKINTSLFCLLITDGVKDLVLDLAEKILYWINTLAYFVQSLGNEGEKSFMAVTPAV